MPRQQLDIFWQSRIADLMLNEGLRNGPSEITARLKLDDEENEPGERTAPELRTVEKYMALIRTGKMALLFERKRFEWPRDMGSGEDRVPWSFSRHALDCLAFYLENHNERPMVGLTKRFAWVASSSPGLNVQPRAVLAEQLWYADLVGNIPGRERPSTAYLELKLATRWWEPKDPSSWEECLTNILQIAQELGVKEIAVPKFDFKFIRYMPEFRKVLEAQREDAEALMETK